MNSKFNVCAILLVLLLSNNSCFAQSSTNQITLNKLTPWNFSLSTPAQLENDQTISGAFSLVVKTKSKGCSVYANINSWSYPSGFTLPSSPLEIHYTSTNSPSAYNIATSPIALTSSNQLLFNQNKTGSAYTFYYDMILPAVGYDWYPGNYSFTITFTMTQP